MISVASTYKQMLVYLFNNLESSTWVGLVNFLLGHSDDELDNFDKFSEITDTLESFCEDHDLPEGFWMIYGNEIDIIKDVFFILSLRLCELLQKS